MPHSIRGLLSGMDAFVLPIVVAMAMVVDPLSIIRWFKSKLIVRISDFADFALGKMRINL